MGPGGPLPGELQAVCPQSSPASGSFPMSRFFTSGGQSIGVSASASMYKVVYALMCDIHGSMAFLLVSRARPLPSTRWSRLGSSRRLSSLKEGCSIIRDKLRGRFRNLKATIILLHAGCACMHSTYEYGCLVDHIVCKGGEEAADTNKPPMFLPSAVRSEEHTSELSHTLASRMPSYA